MTTALETIGLGKRYGLRRWALRDLDITVEQGTITALVGPNGSGKSTLLKAWVGFERPTAGRLRIHGVDPVRQRGRAIALTGYVPQQPSLYRELTIAEHLEFASVHRPGFDASLARGYLDDLSIPLVSRADQLSGGQQAQVGLALALGSRAPVLLLDEPLASLDPLARREFLHLMVEAVRAAGATALLSSHVITDIEQACDRLIVLGKGHTLLDLSVAEALAHHRVVEGTAPEAIELVGRDAFVGAFPAPAGEPLTLVRVPVAHDVSTEGPADGRPATLEEVVIGHMAAGRVRRAAAAAAEEAA